MSDTKTFPLLSTKWRNFISNTTLQTLKNVVAFYKLWSYSYQNTIEVLIISCVMTTFPWPYCLSNLFGFMGALYFWQHVFKSSPWWHLYRTFPILTSLYLFHFDLWKCCWCTCENVVDVRDSSALDKWNNIASSHYKADDYHRYVIDRDHN